MDTIKEYNLDRSQLAFTLGKKTIINGQISMFLYPHTTVFSEEMEEYNEKKSDTDIETESLAEESNPLSSNRHIYKYAPRCGFIGKRDEMLVFLRNKLEPRKYGG
jgi:hypothetical protein